MKRRIDTVAIRSVGEYIIKELEELVQIKNKLLIDIERIPEIYNGDDASIIVSRYQARVKSLDSIIKNYENYAIYMQNLSNAYSKNLEESKKKFNSVLDTVTTDQNAIMPETTFSNLSNVVDSENIEGEVYE